MFNIKRIKAELIDLIKIVFRTHGYWVFAPGFFAVLAVYFIDKNMKNADGTNYILCTIGDTTIFLADFILKPWNEAAAIVILAITSFIFAIRLFLYSFNIDKIFFALSTAFLCREIHFAYTHSGIYVTVVLILIWCVIWNEKLFKEFSTSIPVQLVTLGTGFTYFITMFIQRRCLKFIIPESFYALEQKLHIPLEEVTENTAHIFFLLLAVACFTLSTSPQKNDPGPKTGPVVK